ncbi:toll/interleukin-1 receptor domain-containing protein [Roseiconus lacunae]|uniref:Toll/interleukin-1 receptor domain-containing protein n=1 Tax=Roseiconus lacunae TaxID=2605694 RepID=A0ABT7PSQ0_9BACT|nr:toll/interleukin-1 receptor domain-containing protein [Roseiconus lacunae]MDM4019490.1 toll/interleukin-1 receptor domain-containing protein [Roseiconus lacunae]
MPSVFLSHSSKDKQLARRIAADMVAAHVEVWLDEWEILVGDSITQRIQMGLEGSEFVAVLLSGNSIESGWVEKEWQSKIGDEAATRQVSVLPLLVDDVRVPPLLRDKKYADFRHDYDRAMEELVVSVRGHSKRKDPSPDVPDSPNASQLIGDHVSPALLRTIQEARRKTWRPLEVFKFAALPCLLEEKEPHVFMLYLAYSLTQTITHSDYAQFMGLFRKTVRESDGPSLRVYEIVSHYIECIAYARKERTRLIQQHGDAIDEAMRRSDPQQLYDIEGANFEKLMAPLRDHWDLLWNVNLSPHLVPLQITFDRTTKSIEFKSLEVPSIDLESFPGKLETTSEMLKFVGATMRPFLPMNDIDSFLFERRSTMGMMIDLLDNRLIDVDSIRINVDDYEEWDYLNPRFDAEIERMDKRT